jgi:RHS repeat-associated protein
LVGDDRDDHFHCCHYLHLQRGQPTGDGPRQRRVAWHYTHDGRGNLVRQTPGGTEPAEGETRYTYDGANQLVRVELYTAGGYTTLAEGAYNADGERVRLTTYAAGVPLTVTYAVFQGELLVADDGTQDTLYLHGRSLIAEYGSEWAYHLRDGESSLRQVADESGAITLLRAYKPFGGILQEQGPYETAFGFLGAQLDRVSGLLYSGGRYYDPATGRFLTPERTFDPYNPRTLNPYAPLQNPALWLLAPLGLVAALWGKKRRKYGYWLLLLLLVGVGTSAVLTGCQPEPPPPPPPPPPTLPPLEDTDILDVPWADEMTEDMRREYPNSCGLLALYMFLQAEGQTVDLATLAQQLRQERPGGYDGYCCYDSLDGVPATPTPDPLGWCNEACVSAEALADVTRRHYGMAIESGDNWTRERVHQKLLAGHPVLALVRVELSIDQFGHFVVIRGLVKQGATVVFNDSYPGEEYWYWNNVTAEERQAVGEGKREDWSDFDDSWASAIDKGLDPLALQGHVRWAMAVQ